MNTILPLLHDGGPLLFLQILAALLALVVCLASGVLLIGGRRVPPVVPVGAMALVPVLGLVGMQQAKSQVLAALSVVAPEMKATLLAGGVTKGLINAGAPGVLLVVPGVGLAILCAIAGILRPPRQATLPLLVAGLTLALVGLAGGAGVLTQSVDVGLARGGIYAVLGGLTAVALAGRGAAALAGTTTAAALPILVGALEVSAMAQGRMSVFHAIAFASPAQKLPLLEVGMAEVDAAHLLVWTMLAVSLVVAGLGVWGSTEDGRPSWGAMLALPLGLVGIAMLVFDSGDLLRTIGSTW